VGVLKGYEAEERVPREVYLDQKTWDNTKKREMLREAVHQKSRFD
jgi:hypothetical protein